MSTRKVASIGHPYSQDIVRGNCWEIWDDLEMLDIVEFLSILIKRGPKDFISTECKFFYPVAFFCDGFEGSRPFRA